MGPSFVFNWTSFPECGIDRVHYVVTVISQIPFRSINQSITNTHALVSIKRALWNLLNTNSLASDPLQPSGIKSMWMECSHRNSNVHNQTSHTMTINWLKTAETVLHSSTLYDANSQLMSKRKHDTIHTSAKTVTVIVHIQSKVIQMTGHDRSTGVCVH